MGLGAGPVINALATGALPLRVLGSVNEVTLLFGLVAQKGLGSVSDLRGKKISVTLGTNYQYFLEAGLADAGLTTNDVTIVDAQPNEGTIAFLAGRVDATVPDYSDTKIIPRRREGAKVIITGADIGKSKSGSTFRIFDLWVAPQKAFDSDKAAISRVMKAVSHWADFVGNPRNPRHRHRFRGNLGLENVRQSPQERTSNRQWNGLGADRLSEGAPRAETAAARNVDRTRNLAGEGEGIALRLRIGHGNGGKQGTGVGVGRPIEQLRNHRGDG